MKWTLAIVLMTFGFVLMNAQNTKKTESELDKIKKIQVSEMEKLSNIQDDFNEFKLDFEKNKSELENIQTLYQHTNDRLNNYLTYTAIIASIFGVLIALAGIYIGFESLRSQSRRKDAIKTLEEAKSYVNSRKTDFDELIENKKTLLQDEYNNIIRLLQDKLLSDIEIETSKVKSIVEEKSEEIKSFSVERQQSKTIELLEKRLEFFENVGIPDEPKILFSKGKLLHGKEMYADAISLFEKLVEKEPNHKDAYWYLGYDYAQIGENDKSIESYKKELSLNPNNSSALNNIALQYKKRGELLEALEHFNKAIDTSSKKELYYMNRIGVLEKLNSNDRIIEDYLSLISINPSKSDYYESLIEILDKENRSKDIEEYYDKAINHFKDEKPETSNYFTYKKGEYFGKIGKEIDAIDLFQSLIDNDYKTEYCYIKIADLKNSIGQDEEAIAILENGLQSNPRLSSLYLFKAFFESNTSTEKAKETIDKGGELINNESFFFNCGRFFNQKNKLSIAKYCYEGALKLIENKLEEGEKEEVDIMNYYETCVILQKPLDKFESDYRYFVLSEKYQIILTVIDSLKKVIENFEGSEKQQVLDDIKALNIEAKDKDLINWNFSDLYWFVKSNKSEELADFSSRIIKYIERKIKFEEI